MNIENEPFPVVRLNKKIIVLVVVLASAIVAIILSNLVTAAHSKPQEKTPEPVEEVIVESNESPKWYQEESAVGKLNLQKSNHVVVTKNNKTEAQNLASATENKEALLSSQQDINLSDDERAQKEQEEEELKAAMRAPLNSNQLVAESVDMHSSQENVTQNLSLNSMHGDKSDKANFLLKGDFATDEELDSEVKSPSSSYILQAGTIIPGVLITGINSDLPGQVIGQVKSPIYDTVTGSQVIIPQGARLAGLYDSQIVYGQKRVLIIWQRILFPNGQSLSLKAMPGIDLEGYAGFKDKVNNHFTQLASSVLLMSVLGAGAELSQPQQSYDPFAAPSVGQTLAQNLGIQIAETATTMVNKSLNIQPTLEIRPGYEFNVLVAKDIALDKPYDSK